MRFKFEPGFELVWSDRDMARAIGSATSAEIGVRVPWTSEYLPPIAMTLTPIGRPVFGVSGIAHARTAAIQWPGIDGQTPCVEAGLVHAWWARRDDCPLWFEFHACYRLRWHAVPQYLSDLLGAEVRA